MQSNDPSLLAPLRRLRNRLVPEALGLGWMPVYLLGYLLFLFVPMLVTRGVDWNGAEDWNPWLTLASVGVFLPMYFLAYRVVAWQKLACTLGIAALGYALMPSNPFSNTYIIYAAGFIAMLGGPLWRRLAWLAAICGLYVAEAVALDFPLFVPAITLLVSAAVFSGNHFQAENVRKRAELKLSHEEVRRLAALAERERIGRDLHDLLGHTLSLVALKSDLAGRLVARDPEAARREIDEVSRVARDALAQVRRAVTGIRAAGLAAELASAKLLLESDGVAFTYTTADIAIPPELETVLALSLREAVTNIQRHARASLAEVSLAASSREVTLRVRDNGAGGAVAPGNGLTGMRERVEAHGGRLRIESAPRQGTQLEATLPIFGGDADDEVVPPSSERDPVGAT